MVAGGAAADSAAAASDGSEADDLAPEAASSDGSTVDLVAASGSPDGSADAVGADTGGLSAETRHLSLAVTVKDSIGREFIWRRPWRALRRRPLASGRRWEC